MPTMQVSENLVSKYAGALTALASAIRHAWQSDHQQQGAGQQRHLHGQDHDWQYGLLQGQGHSSSATCHVCISPRPWEAMQAMMQHRSQLTW